MSRNPSSMTKFLRPLIVAAMVVSGLLAIAQTRPAAPGAAATKAPAPAVAGTERKLASTVTMAYEASAVVKLLEEIHFNRTAISSADYPKAIPHYMEALDPLRLFFLKSDKDRFTQEHGRSLYFTVDVTGDISAAYEIFETYAKNARSRVAWIMEELKKDVDLGTNETYVLDRSKAEWPETTAAADDLWKKRIKFELLTQILAAKEDKRSTPEGMQAVVAAAKETVRKRYERYLKMNVEEFKNFEMSELFLSAITQIYDPHSTYQSPESYEDFMIQMRQVLYGIGALLSEDKNDYACVVDSLIPGGPADLGKVLKPQDKIMAVAQSTPSGWAEPVDIMGMKLRQIVDLIRGPQGSKVKLIVQPAGSDATTRKEIEITRDLVKLTSTLAHGALFEVPAADGKITKLGVITLPTFYGGEEAGERTSATKDVAELLRRMQDAGMQAFVLDLRKNGGGLLSEAIDLAGLFIRRGPVVQVKFYNGSVKVDQDNDPSVAYSGPMAVLVDRFSASASEIVAGALQNYGRAIIIGDSSTHGKGTVQQIIDLQDVPALRGRTPVNEKAGAVKVTIQKFYLPNGSSTQQRGVVPDLVLPSVDEFIPNIGEASLENSLVYDEIPRSTAFDGRPLDPTVLNNLVEASRRRQESLPEFAFLRKSIDRFQARVNEKALSLNLAARQKQKLDDTAFVKALKEEREELAKTDSPFTEFRLRPAPAPRIRAPDEDADTDLLAADDETQPYKMDINLRESFRVLTDALALATAPQYLSSNAKPLALAEIRQVPAGSAAGAPRK